MEINDYISNLNFDKEFIDLLAEINSSKYMLDLEENWDDEGALVISKNIWGEASIFLLKIATKIRSENNKFIFTPCINPVCNGSVDLSWDENNNILLINVSIKDDKINISYYGCTRNDGDYINEIKSSHSIYDEDIQLTNWISDFLTIKK